MAERLDVAEALTRFAREIHAPRDLDTILQAIVDGAARSLPGIDHVGITSIQRGGRLETVAATDQLVQELDTLQYELAEGPCIHAIQTDPVVTVENAAHDQRWPKFMTAAFQRGLRAQMGLRLYVEDQTLGSLNCYSTSSETVDARVPRLAALYAQHAALAMDRALREDQLQHAVRSRQVIGQAVGIVMARFDLEEGRAFDYLRRASSHGNTKLRDIAQEVVDAANRRGKP